MPTTRFSRLMFQRPSRGLPARSWRAGTRLNRIEHLAIEADGDCPARSDPTTSGSSGRPRSSGVIGKHPSGGSTCGSRGVPLQHCAPSRLTVDRIGIWPLPNRCRHPEAARRRRSVFLPGSYPHSRARGGAPLSSGPGRRSPTSGRRPGRCPCRCRRATSIGAHQAATGHQLPGDQRPGQGCGG